jgi:hypothetical protein
MKKFVLLAAMLAMVLAVAAAPAMANDLDLDDLDDGFFIDDDDDLDFGDIGRVIQGVENEAESGEVDLSFEVSNEGDYASQCVPTLQFGNSGNFNNAPSFVQFDSDSDDFEAGGIEFSVGGDLAVECSSTVQQSAAASR